MFHIEVPGVEDVQNGARNYDFIQDILIPHVFYFISQVFNNLMERNGFKNILLNSKVEYILFIHWIRKKID